MKKPILSTLVILVLVNASMIVLVMGQVKSSGSPPIEWSKTYEFGVAHHLIKTSDGGYALGGAGSANLVKTDENGNEQWTRIYEFEQGAGNGYSVVQTNDGGYAMGGGTRYGSGSEPYDFLLVKADSLGNKQWSRTYGHPYPYDEAALSVIQTNDGGYALVGSTNAFGRMFDMWFVKTDADGNLQWDEAYGGSGMEEGWSVVQTNDGGYAIAGSKDIGVGNSDAWLVRTDGNGNRKWDKTYGGLGYDDAQSIIQTSDNGFALAGDTTSSGAGGYDFYLLKTDLNGNMEWSRAYGGTDDEQAYSVIQTDDGGYAVVGYTVSFAAGIIDVWVVKTDSTGNEQWNISYGGAEENMGYDIVQTHDGGYAVSGRTESAGDTVYFLMKLEPEQSLNDLALINFSPVQAVYSASALVADKPTVFRVVVQNSFPEIKPLRIRFTYNDGSPTDYLTTIAANAVKEVFIPFGSHILPQAGTITYSTEIDPGNRIQESNEFNNFKSGSSKVKETRGMKVLYIPVAWVGEQTVTPEQIRLDASQASDFIEATYPFGIDDYSDLVKTNPHHFYRQPILTLCIAIQIQAWLSGQDKGVAIVPDNWLDTNVGQGTTGYCYTGIGGVLVETNYWTTVAHELGHTCGLWNGPNGGPDDEEYRHSNNVPGVGIGRPASGYWVTLNRQIGKTYGATTETAICFMGSSDFSQHTLFNRWICKEDYEKLLTTFKTNPDPEILLVSGVIFDNDTAELADWFHLPEGEADLLPGSTGEFTLKLLGQQNETLDEFSFNSSEPRTTSETSNFTGFAYRIPYDGQTKRILLLRGSNVIAEKIVSDNSPTVNLSFPNGGERLVPGNNCTVTWSASDPDGDNLTYTVLHSSDGGTNWIPLAYGLTDNFYSWDTSFSEPSAYNLIKVVATDGVNTCTDISEGNFTILDVDPPSIDVISPESRTYYSDMVPLTFQIGESVSWIGYSLDDGSNSTIGGNTTIQVGEGQHHIRLYANDSSGNMGFSETTCFFVNSSAYSPWESSFTSLDGYPVTSLAVHDGRLYAVANNKLYSYDNTSLSVVAAPTYLTSLESYSGRLVVGGQDGLYYLDNATLKLAFPVPTYIKTLGVHNNVLYAGTFLDKPPTLYYCNGSVDNPSDWDIDTGFWNILNFSGPFGSIDSFVEYNATPYITSGGTVYSFNGTDWNIADTFDDVYSFSCMKVYNDKLYLASRDQGWRKPAYQGYSGFNGRIFEFDGTDWKEVFEHDYWIFSLEVYNGKLYAGTANKIYAFNGIDWSISFDAAQEGYYAITMKVYADKIYAGIGNGYIFADPAPIEANSKIATIPEFSSATILVVFLAVAMLTTVLMKRKLRRFA